MLRLLSGFVSMDPMHQFEIHPLIPIHLTIGGRLVDISFTNASLLMLIAVACIVLFLTLATTSRSLVPGRSRGWGRT